MSDLTVKERLGVLWRRLFTSKKERQKFRQSMRCHEETAVNLHQYREAAGKPLEDDFKFYATLLSMRKPHKHGVSIYTCYLAEHFDGRRGIFCLRRVYTNEGELVRVTNSGYAHLTQKKARSLLYFLERYCQEELGDDSVGQVDSGAEGDD